MPLMKREIVEVIQPVLAERNKGPVADQLVDIPVPLVMEEIVAVVQEVVRLVPQRTSAAAENRRANGARYLFHNSSEDRDR